MPTSSPTFCINVKSRMPSRSILAVQFYFNLSCSGKAWKTKRFPSGIRKRKPRFSLRRIGCRLLARHRSILLLSSNSKAGFRVSGSAAYSSSSSIITTMPPIRLFSSFLVILMMLGTTPSGCSSIKYASSLSQSFSSSQPLK